MTSLDDIAGKASSGILYGIGVGPGHPRYLTLRAAGLIKSVDVLAYFAKKGRPGNARTIVTPLVEVTQVQLRLEYPLTTELPASHPDYQKQIHEFYEESALTISDQLGEGRSVGLLSEGDPFFYGSFMHMWHRLCENHEVEVIPGVTGMSGCWTRANTPITWGDDILRVLPGTLPEDKLTQQLQQADACVIMKVGRNLGKVRRAIAKAGLTQRAIYVERGMMEGEIIMPVSELEKETGPYFAMVLIPGKGRRL